MLTDKAEKALGDLYDAFVEMYDDKQYQCIYDTMGILIAMMELERKHLLEKYNVKS